MQVRRDVVTSPTGQKFVVAFAPVRGIDTTAFWAGPLYPLRSYAVFLDFVGWVRHKVRGKGRWIVAAARLGDDGRPAELVRAATEPDRISARDFAQDLKLQIRAGAIT